MGFGFAMSPAGHDLRNDFREQLLPDAAMQAPQASGT
jgi:hypothetical protein